MPSKLRPMTRSIFRASPTWSNAPSALNGVTVMLNEPGHHLRAQRPGDLIGVSPTPIRSALNLLAKRGIVQPRKNHGYFLQKPFDSLHPIEIGVPPSADENLYQRLVRDRLDNIVPNS